MERINYKINKTVARRASVARFKVLLLLRVSFRATWLTTDLINETLGRVSKEGM